MKRKNSFRFWLLSIFWKVSVIYVRNQWHKCNTRMGTETISLMQLWEHFFQKFCKQNILQTEYSTNKIFYKQNSLQLLRKLQNLCRRNRQQSWNSFLWNYWNLSYNTIYSMGKYIQLRNRCIELNLSFYIRVFSYHTRIRKCF
jgi:hypothetical protein